MRLRTTLLAAYLAVATLSLTGVLFRGVATSDVRFLGLPAGLAWVTCWAIATPLALWAYTVTRPSGDGDRERT